MSRVSFFIFIFLWKSLVVAQVQIHGKVTDSANQPLEGASVYLNNTTIGTITNKEGEFSIPLIMEGNHELVISFIGFQPFRQSVHRKQGNTRLEIKLIRDSILLNEVAVKPTIYDEEWRYNLNRFKKYFLGKSALAETCEILNEKDIFFTYDAQENKLTAYSRKPIIIKNNGLGYRIHYDLVNFELFKNRLFFAGYARYENLKKRIKNKWKKNRKKAFLGSSMHFFRSLLQENLRSEGFIVHQFQRIKNPDYPSKEEIRKAFSILQNQGKLIINSNNSPSLKNVYQDSMLVNAKAILKKRQLPKFQDILYKQNVPYKDMLSLEGNTPYLQFKDYLSILYTKEPEEENYWSNLPSQKRKQAGIQTSNIHLLQDKIKIYNTGILQEPQSLLSDGYWGFESLAEMLPLNYQIRKEK